MKRNILYCLFIILGTVKLIAQPSIEWQVCLGGPSPNGETAWSTQQTTDGGYIVVGVKVAANGAGDIWVVKFDPNGSIQWQSLLGGSEAESAYSIQQTTDGGYILGGWSNSNDGDVSGNHSGTSIFADMWVVKLNSVGAIQWQKSLGGTLEDKARTIQQTSDGGYIVAGHTFSNDGDVTTNHGIKDCWVVKLNSSGNIQWQRSLGGSDEEEVTSIVQTSDGGYILAAYTRSNDGDVSGNHGHVEYWIAKLDSNGLIQWQKCLGGSSADYAYSIRQTFDGGYVVAGTSDSFDGDVVGNHGGDYWIVKLNSAGNLIWQTCLGGSGSETAKSISLTTDGGYVIAGYANSTDGDVTGLHGSFHSDFWIVKLNVSGLIQWQKCYGGSLRDMAHSIQQTTDGGFIVAGNSSSNDGDVSGNNGYDDFWIVKLSATSNIEEIHNQRLNFRIAPNPFSESTNLSFEAVNFDLYTIKIIDIEGRKVRTITKDRIELGLNEFVWDGMCDSGKLAKEGIYFATISSDKIFQTKRLILLRN